MKFSLHFTKVFLALLWYSFPLWGSLAAMITLGGCALALIDDIPITTGIYFAWITSTTIGYGDLVPTTEFSRLLVVFIAFLGMPFNGLIVALSVLATKLAVDKHGRLVRMIQSASFSLLDLDDDASVSR